MSLLFLALGVLMLCINLLGRAFPVKAEAEPEHEIPTPTLPPPGGRSEGARVAAIAVALALATSPPAPLLRGEGSAPATVGPESWVILGRQAQMSARRKQG